MAARQSYDLVCGAWRLAGRLLLLLLLLLLMMMMMMMNAPRRTPSWQGRAAAVRVKS
jgi:hypothetical protein